MNQHSRPKLTEATKDISAHMIPLAGSIFSPFHPSTQASCAYIISLPNMALNVENDVTHPHGHHVGLGRPVVIVEHHHRQHHAARHHHHDAVEVGAWEYWDQGQDWILLENDL